MSSWGLLHYLASGVLLLLLAIFFVYVLARVASFAHFRTKLEYLRSAIKELNGGRRNGQD